MIWKKKTKKLKQFYTLKKDFSKICHVRKILSDAGVVNKKQKIQCSRDAKIKFKMFVAVVLNTSGSDTYKKIAV